MNALYAIVYRRGPAWVAGRSVYEQALRAHRDYMLGLHERQCLRLGGPFQDDSGGLVVIAADSIDEAQALIADDPAVRDGIMLAETHPWRLLAGRL